MMLYRDIALQAVTAHSSPSGPLQVFKAEFFKALAHPVRIRILEVLIKGERSVQDLQEALQLEQPIVSQHLAMLRAKNIVKARKEGTTVWYTVRVPLMGELLAIARRVFDSQLIDSQTMLKELRREGRRR
jgi:DNA-binding transcriptional ArsR family regulator